MNTDKLDKYVTDAFAGTLTFPGLLENIASTGVRWYSAILHFGITIYSFGDGRTHLFQWPGWKPTTTCPPFDQDRLQAAIRAGHQGDAIYLDFLREIGAAGVAVYTVHLKGGRAVYVGADGDLHVEEFPAVK